MTPIAFYDTRSILQTEIQKLKKSSHHIFTSLHAVWQEEVLLDQQTPCSLSAHIYLFNRYIIQQMIRMKDFIHLGIVNTEEEYFESDFETADFLARMMSYKLNKNSNFHSSIIYNPEEIHLKINAQLRIFERILNDLPDSLAGNYHCIIKPIANVRLDVFQLMYLGLKQLHFYFDQLKQLSLIPISQKDLSIAM